MGELEAPDLRVKRLRRWFAESDLFADGHMIDGVCEPGGGEVSALPIGGAIGENRGANALRAQCLEHRENIVEPQRVVVDAVPEEFVELLHQIALGHDANHCQRFTEATQPVFLPAQVPLFEQGEQLAVYGWAAGATLHVTRVLATRMSLPLPSGESLAENLTASTTQR